MLRERIYTIMSRKLSGEATSSELAELDDLIKQYPHHQLPVEIIEEFWHLPIENDTDFLEATYHLHSNKLKNKGYSLEEGTEGAEEPLIELPEVKTYKKWKMPLLLSGIFFAIASFFLLTISTKHKKTIAAGKEFKGAESEVTTKKGNRTKILLPDGTSVWLNGNSRLIYNNQHFGEVIREVTLTGEAYFDVVKNAARPFVIHTIAMDIKVLGTAFNVKSYAAEKTSEAALIRGSIEVTLINKKNEKVTLKPNEKITVSNTKPLIKNHPASVDERKTENDSATQTVAVNQLKFDSREKTFKEIAWTENKLMFKNESLELIAMMLERWYGKEVVINNEKLKSLQFTGNFHDENIIQVLQALQVSYNFNFKEEENTIRIY